MTATHGPHCNCKGCRDYRDGVNWALSIQPSYVRDDLAAAHEGDDPQGGQR